MLSLRPIATAPLLAPPAGDVPPYEIDLDRDAEIERVFAVILTVYDEAGDA